MPDTIFAQSTPVGTGGIAIIRISGTKAEEIIKEIFSPAYKEEDFIPRKLYYGDIVRGGEIIDKVMAVIFRAPNSYTGEDMAEIHCHGGQMAITRLMSLLSEVADRAAKPGEFTKRAFLNGKMDLTEAEAVMSYIGSISEAGAKNAVMQLSGVLGNKINEIKAKLINLTSYIEAVIEYPEEDFDAPEKTAKESLTEARDLIDALIKSFNAGKIIKEGFYVAIVGKTNVGKSSLLNAISGEQKAIVTEIPGTTRDIVEALVSVNGIPVCFWDTAGMRDTLDKVEAIGIDRTKEKIENADMIMFVIDSSEKLSEEDIKILNKLNEKNMFIVLNKTDEEQLTTEEDIKKLTSAPIINVSAKTGKNIEGIFEYIFSNLAYIPHSDGLIITNERHKNSLSLARDNLNEAIAALGDFPLDVISINILDALNCLGEITGENITEEIIDKIFTNFCLGK
ncbi:MAG: tRNA uridine-5-carboxymethylaminomethyl(34) synthesis GTPase MnmE [Eubacteriales bacterium]